MCKGIPRGCTLSPNFLLQRGRLCNSCNIAVVNSPLNDSTLTSLEVDTMNIAHSIPSTVSSISFSFLSTEDIRRISVKQIVNPVLLDDLNRPNIGGLYDPALGPSDRQDMCVWHQLSSIRSPLNIFVSCATCRLTYFTCPGHFGHIELPSPVYHPLFMMNMFNLLRGTCLFCHRFKLGRSVVRY